MVQDGDDCGFWIPPFQERERSSERASGFVVVVVVVVCMSGGMGIRGFTVWGVFLGLAYKQSIIWIYAFFEMRSFLIFLGGREEKGEPRTMNGGGMDGGFG